MKHQWAITLKISGPTLSVLINDEDPIDIIYETHGDTLVAQLGPDLYYVIYFKDRDTAYMSGVKFTRIASESP